MNPSTMKFVIADIDGSAASLAAAANVLSTEGVGIDILSCTNEQVVFLPTNVEKAVNILNDAGMGAVTVDYVAVDAPAGTGQFKEIWQGLVGAGINIDNCILTPDHLYIGASDPSAVARVLEGVALAAV